jgi:hypothetical protein
LVERDERLSRMKTSRGNLSDGNVEGKQQSDLGGVNKQQGPNSIRLNEKINGSDFMKLRMRVVLSRLLLLDWL